MFYCLIPVFIGISAFLGSDNVKPKTDLVYVSSPSLDAFGGKVDIVYKKAPLKIGKEFNN